MTPPQSLRAFVCGRTGSGKSTILRELLLPRFPRALVVDFLGAQEWHAPGAAIVNSLAELAPALEAVARRASWRVVAQLSPSEAEEVAEWLLPRRLAGAASFARAVGGMALVCDEVDLLAPAKGASEAVLNLARRGRHIGLSLLTATQRPAQVHRLFTSQCELLALCAQHEPRDVRYVAEVVPPEVMRRLETLPPYGCVLWDTLNRIGYVLSRERVVIETLGKREGVLSIDGRASESTT